MKLRRFLIILGVLGVVVLILVKFSGPHKLLATFSHINWYLFPLAILVQSLDYVCSAQYYRKFFAISGHKVGFWRLYQASLAINFSDTAIPSGGVASATYFTQALKGSGVPSGKTTLAQLGRYSFTLLSFLFILAVGFLLLFFAGDLDSPLSRFVLFLMMLLLTAGTVLLVSLSEPSRLQAVIKAFVNIINSFGRKILRRKKPLLKSTGVDKFIGEFYQGYNELTSHKRRWPVLLAWCAGCNICEVLTLYLVMASFGALLNPGIAITTYTIGIIASAGGLVFNGTGAYEAAMVAAMAALGAPIALALASVTVYRLIDLGFFLPIGLYFYRNHLKEQI